MSSTRSSTTKTLKTAAIVQSNYLPWRGYFDLIRSADEFILLDNVQYTRRDWRNRNLIRTPSGSTWITIPVEVKGKYTQSIDETRVADTAWADRHVRAIELNYSRSAAFDSVGPWLFRIMRECSSESLLSRINEWLLKRVAERLSINTPIRRATDLIDRNELARMSASERLAALCEAVGCSCYLSGPSARSYLDESALTSRGLTITWMDYSGYPDYSQAWPGFDPHVSVIDLLLNVGDNAAAYLGRDKSAIVGR